MQEEDPVAKVQTFLDTHTEHTAVRRGRGSTYIELDYIAICIERERERESVCVCVHACVHCAYALHIICMNQCCPVLSFQENICLGINFLFNLKKVKKGFSII